MGNSQTRNKDVVSGVVIKEAYDNFSKTLAHPDYSDKLHTESKGIWEMWEQYVAKYGDANCMAYREYMIGGMRGEYKFWSYKQVNTKVERIADGLDALKLSGEKNVGIWSKNSPEWMLASLACWRQRCKVVPFYDTLGPEAMLYILELTGITVLFTEAFRLDKIIELVQNNKAKVKLETIVILDPFENNSNNGLDLADQERLQKLSMLDLSLVTLSDFQESSECASVSGSADDIAIIMFTSGTTGKPKGALLSHSNVATSAYSGSCMIQEFPKVVKTLRHYSYLPLPHIFEMAMEMFSFANGACVYYSTGDLKKLVEELQLVKPTIFAGVPRVYQKFYDKIMLAAQSGLKGWLIRQCLSGDGYITKSLGVRDIFYNKLLTKISKKLGLNECQLLISGAAPLSGYLHEFLLNLIPGVSVMQGYGMTETTACGTVMRPDDRAGGHVGGPTLVTYIKLRDVPEMNRLHSNNPPDGEILIGGPANFKGYYKNPAKTEETLIDESGTMWVATGDIGVICPNNSIKIVDRKKNIFKLAQGEYIAVEKIEMAYSKCPAVNQLWVYGNSYKTCIVAVVNPSLPWIWKQEFFPATPDVDPMNPKVAGPVYAKWVCSKKNREMLTKACLAEMEIYANELKGFEKVKAIYLEEYVSELGTAFTPENNLLTPSMKLMRPKLKARYLDEIKNMYTGLGMAPQAGENW